MARVLVKSIAVPAYNEATGTWTLGLLDGSTQNHYYYGVRNRFVSPVGGNNCQIKMYTIGNAPGDNTTNYITGTILTADDVGNSAAVITINAYKAADIADTSAAAILNRDILQIQNQTTNYITVSALGAVTSGPSTGASGTLEHTFQSSTGNTYVSIKPVISTALSGILLYGNSLNKWTIINNASASLHDLETRDSGNNVVYSINQSGNSTIGRSSLVSDTFHIVRGNCGIAFTNLSGAVGIGSNLNAGTARNFNRLTTTTNGAAIGFDANATAAQQALTFWVQPPGGSVGGTTGSIDAGNIKGTSAWVFGSGLQGANVRHKFIGSTGANFHTILTVEGSPAANSLSVSAVGTGGSDYCAMIHDRSFVDSYLWFSQANTNRFRFITTTNDAWYPSGSSIAAQAGYAELGSIGKLGEWKLGKIDGHIFDNHTKTSTAALTALFSIEPSVSIDANASIIITITAACQVAGTDNSSYLLRVGFYKVAGGAWTQNNAQAVGAGTYGNFSFTLTQATSKLICNLTGHGTNLQTINFSVEITSSFTSGAAAVLTPVYTRL